MMTVEDIINSFRIEREETEAYKQYANTLFQDQGGIEIGDGSLIGHNVVLATINHDLRPAYNRKNHYKPVKIGRYVWIGSNSTILPGITVGDWAVIGAGSVVTKDVESFTIVAGNPARVIRRLTEEEINESVSNKF